MNFDFMIKRIEKELTESTNLMRGYTFGSDRDLRLIDVLYKLETIKHLRELRGLREAQNADKES